MQFAVSSPGSPACLLVMEIMFAGRTSVFDLGLIRRGGEETVLSMKRGLSRNGVGDIAAGRWSFFTAVFRGF